MAERKKPTPSGPAAPLRSNRGADPAPRRMQSSELFGRADQLIIEHAGREYRLRVTTNGKLILTA